MFQPVNVFQVAAEVRKLREEQDDDPTTKEWRKILAIALSDDQERRQVGEVLLGVWLNSHPDSREWTVEVFQHLREDHGPTNRQGKCIICLAKACFERVERERAKGPREFLHAVTTSPLLNGLEGNDAMMRVFMLTQELP